MKTFVIRIFAFCCFAIGLGVSAQSLTGSFSPAQVAASASSTLTLNYSGFTPASSGAIFRLYYKTADFSAGPTFTSTVTDYQGTGGALAGTLAACAGADTYVTLNWVNFGNAWPAAASGQLGTAAFTTSATFGANTNVCIADDAGSPVARAGVASTYTLNVFIAPVPTAPTATLAAGATLTGGSGSVQVTVATAGVATGSLGLACTIPAGAASFAVTGGGTRTIAAPAVLGANAPAIGLSCTPQAAAATATLSCAQTPNPAAALPALTSTITCPAAAAASITYTATPATLTFTGVTSGTPTATQPVTVQANAANTGALNVASCAFGGANAADFSFSPAQTFPQSVAAGASAALPVRFTPAAADSAARSATLTCQTPNATAGGTQFVVALNGTNPAPVPIVVTPTTPAGNVVLPALTIGATPAFVTTGLNFSVSGGAATLTCVVAGAGYTATGSPLSLVVGTTLTLTVTYTGATAGTFTGTLTCTSTAPATGGPFVYNLSTTVQAAPAIGPTVQVPTIGTFGLGLLGLLIAGFAGWVQRRQVK